MVSADQSTNRREITFPNGHRAQLVAPPAGTPAAAILEALELTPPQPLIILAGGAAGLEESLHPRLLQIFRLVAQIAADAGAVIMDGGTHSGVMALMGQAVAERGHHATLLGVAPAGRVTYPGGPEEESPEDTAPLDHHHSHFMLVDSQAWGGETEAFYELAETLAAGAPVVTLLLDGGPISKQEVLDNVRRGWPLLVFSGSGRLADDIALHLQQKTRPENISDLELSEILADGDIHLFPLDGSLQKLERLLRQNQDASLRLAWERFARYDENANRQQKSFKKIQNWILRLGVLAALLALSQSQIKLLLPDPNPNPNFWQSLAESLYYPIVVVPILVTLLVAAANRFKAGNKWVLLRGGAEAVKGVIYRYRAGVPLVEEEEPDSPDSRRVQLAHQVEVISRRLMQTEVNLSALRPYDGPLPPQMHGAAAQDDGFSPLTPKRYVTIRLGDQLNYYRGKTNQLERQLKKLSWLIYIFGGLGTFLAAVGLELWVALTTTLVGTFTTFLEYQQIENTLMKYNQTATDLANLQAWWTALPPQDQAEPVNRQRLVTQTETILQTELTGWVQRMEDALASLRAQQTTVGQEKK
jgi:hypothetical protein